MLFNQRFEPKIFVSTIVIVRLKLIRLYNHDDRMLLIMNEKFDDKVSTSFFKRFLELKR